MNLEAVRLPRDRPADAEAGVPRTPFALFDDDGLHAVYARLGLGRHVPFRLLKRALLMAALTWLPVAVLAWEQGLTSSVPSPTNFLADFAAYAQFLVALPLFVAAEAVIDSSTREAARQLVSCAIVPAGDLPELERVHAVIARARTSRWPDVACIALGYVFSLAILVPEFGADPAPTWHVAGAAHHRLLTAAGFWEFLIALPLLNYIWLRFVWKILLWVYYLYRVTRLHLDLHPTHPDLTGGVGFISETQGRFALFILAYGISNIAATVGYEVAILDYDLSIMPVWGPLVGFAIGAPVLFTAPLFLFTKQLMRSKRRALAAYRERVTERSRDVEARWLIGNRGGQPAQDEVRELAELATLGAFFTRIGEMRVVPFDLRSFGQLVGSTLGAMATLLPLLHAKGDLTAIFELFGKLLGRVSGGG